MTLIAAVGVLIMLMIIGFFVHLMTTVNRAISPVSDAWLNNHCYTSGKEGWDKGDIL